MQNDFEKNINQRLQDFSLSPQPEIWQRVEAALPPQKKRRRIFLWWWLPVLGLLAGGIWWVTSREPKVVLQIESVSDTKNGFELPVAEASSIPAKPIDDKPTTTSKTITENTDSERTKIPAPPEKKIVADSLVRNSKKLRQYPRQIIPQKTFPEDAELTATKESTLPSFHSKQKEKQTDSLIKTSNPYHKNDSVTSTFEKENLSSIEKVEASLQTKKDSTTVPALAIASLPKKDTAGLIITDTTAASKTGVITKKKAPKNQSGWMLEAGFGISNLHRNTSSNDKALYNDLYQQNSSSGSQSGGPFFGQLRSFSLPKSSYSLGLGIARKQAFGLHWQGQLALHYQLLSSTQQYGSYTGSQNSIAYNDRFYSTGDTGVYRNTARQLQLAPRITYVIHPTASSPVSFHSGLSVAYNLSINQLLHDYRQGRTYVQSPAYNSRWLLAAEIGAGIFIHQKIYTGITYQHGLSNIARPALQSDFRWQVWQVQVGFPLFRHSSK